MSGHRKPATGRSSRLRKILGMTVVIGATFALGAFYGYMVHRNQWPPHPGPESDDTVTAPMARAIRARQSHPNDPGPLRPANFLVNGGFEEGSLRGWTVVGSVRGTVEADEERLGERYARFRSNGAGQFEVSQFPRVAPATYRLRAHAAIGGDGVAQLFARECSGEGSVSSIPLTTDSTPLELQLLRVSTPGSCQVGVSYEAQGASWLRIDALELTLASGDAAPGFVHPGLLSTSSELEVLARRIETAPSHPSAAAYADLKASNLASMGQRPSPYAIVNVVPSASGVEEAAIKNDALVAYVNALIWAVEGDRRRAAVAMEFLNAWSMTFTELRSPGYPAQVPLEAAWIAFMWANAGELVRHARGGDAGWADAEIQAFSGMLDKLWSSMVSRLPSSNWGTATVSGRMAIGVFQDRRDRFDAGVEEWRRLLPSIVAPSGEVNEIYRDCWHPQYSVANLLQGAEIAWHQGIDLYSTVFEGDATPRLASGVRYLADLLLSSECGAAATEPGYEIALNHYSHRAGVDIPRLRRLVEARARPEQASMLFLGLGTVTHGELSAVE